LARTQKVLGEVLLAQRDGAGVGADHGHAGHRVHHLGRLARAQRMQQREHRAVFLEGQRVGLGHVGLEGVVCHHELDLGAVDAAGLVQRREERARPLEQPLPVGLLDAAVVEGGADAHRAALRERRKSQACGSARRGDSQPVSARRRLVERGAIDSRGTGTVMFEVSRMR
jgi:hypothetical protein